MLHGLLSRESFSRATTAQVSVGLLVIDRRLTCRRSGCDDHHDAGCCLKGIGLGDRSIEPGPCDLSDPEFLEADLGVTVRRLGQARQRWAGTCADCASLGLKWLE